MLSTHCFLLALFVSSALGLPYKHQVALVNSLEVGRDEDPMTWECTGCSEENRPIKSHIIEELSKEVKASLSVYDEYTVLAFRYTANFINVVEDLLFWFQIQDQHAPDGCKVHRQFDKMWNSVRYQTMQGLRKASCTKHLIITGISLGGALAELSYVDIRLTELYDTIELITFGGPNVGNQKWAAWFDDQVETQRVYIRRDPIAFLPICLTKLICNYKQVGVAIVCDKKQEICEKKSSQEMIEEFWDPTELQDDMLNLLEQVKDGDDEQLGSLYDHIKNYPFIINYTLIE